MNRSARFVVAALVVVAAAVIGFTGLGGTDPTDTAREEFVYYPLVTNGFEYRRVPYPEEVTTIRLMAEEPVAIDARRSVVAFWPITREYLADFAKLDESVPGVAEVIDEQGVVTAFEPQPYTLWYPRGLGAEPRLVTGTEAQQTYDTYVEQGRAAFEADRQYQMAVARLQEEIDEWLALAADGVEPLPDPPAELTEPPPEPYVAYAAEPALAPIVQLAAGSYTLRWRGDDGQIVAGSERRLAVSGATKSGVAYTIIPYDRWTQPIFTFDPNESIYLAEDQEVFLAPLRVSRYSAYVYTRLLDPQTIDTPDRNITLWVPDETNPDLTGNSVQVTSKNEVTDNVAWLGYRVFQEPNATRGYTIEEFEADGALQPDFNAMRLPIDKSVGEISLVDPTGNEVANSSRDIRRVPAIPRAALYLPALAFIGLAVTLRFFLPRRHEMRKDSQTI